MNYLFLVSSQEDLPVYQAFVQTNKARMDAFLEYLKANYAVSEIPNTLILTGEDIATRKISSIPIPAYTNEYRTVFCPDTAVWRKIYLQHTDGRDDPQIRMYYDTALTQNHLLQILGHEFVHHSDLFLDEAWETCRWFEEGMCEYISRKWFLTESESSEEARINGLLVKRYEDRHGIRSPESFSQDTYSGTIEDIFYCYWKSFLTVDAAVRKLGSVEAVFGEYHRWFREKTATPLSAWLEL